MRKILIIMIVCFGVLALGSASLAQCLKPINVSIYKVCDKLHILGIDQVENIYNQPHFIYKNSLQNILVEVIGDPDNISHVSLSIFTDTSKEILLMNFMRIPLLFNACDPDYWKGKNVKIIIDNLEQIVKDGGGRKTFIQNGKLYYLGYIPEMKWIIASVSSAKCKYKYLKLMPTNIDCILNF